MYKPTRDGLLILPVYAGISYTAVTFLALRYFGYDLFQMFGALLTIAILIAMYYIYYEFAIYAMGRLSQFKVLAIMLLLPVYPLMFVHRGIYNLYRYDIPIVSQLASLTLRINDAIAYLSVAPYAKTYGIDLGQEFSKLTSFE